MPASALIRLNALWLLLVDLHFLKHHTTLKSQMIDFICQSATVVTNTISLIIYSVYWIFMKEYANKNLAILTKFILAYLNAVTYTINLFSQFLCCKNLLFIFTFAVYSKISHFSGFRSVVL